MSVGNSVFLRRSALPSLETWAKAISKAGFPLTLDPELNVRESTGYRPGTYAGEVAGFEYAVSPARESGLSEQEMQRLGDRDLEVIFTAHSRLHDLVALTIASAVLASITGGRFFNHEAGEWLAGEEALKWARAQEAELRDELAAEAAAPPLPAPPADTTPVAQDCELAARVVFRGGELLKLETLEQPVRQFSVNLVTSELPVVEQVKILGLWLRPGRESLVRRFSMKPKGFFKKTLERRFDAFGRLQLDASQLEVEQWIARLGQVEAATRMLMAAGVAAVPALLGVARDEARPATTRLMALQLIGLVGAEARSALPALGELSRNPVVGEAAKAAQKRIER